ncbi:MAG: penicillin-binding protein 2 [Pseudobutyrivibrio sp.]|nr:penicillin-binding protein 2 [Pseudobutyrivibrio sp.]
MARKSNTKSKKLQNKIYKRMQRKLWFVFSFVCILFVVLIGRIMYIQRSSGERYEKIVLAQQDYDSSIIPFQRGDILDSRGSILATSVDVYNVILDSKVLNANSDYITSTVTAVENCFPNVNIEAMKTQIATNPGSQYYILAKKVPYEQMAKFLELRDSEAFSGKLYGIWFEKEYVREYPYKSLAAATLGFASSGNVGVLGLENKYSSVLNGVNGRSYGYLNSDSNLEKTTIDAVNGNNIVLSLDVNIQQIAEKAVLDWNKEYASEGRLGSKRTAALVMNPKNGEILAMAQYPSFDLQDPYNLSDFYTEEELEGLTEEEKLDKLNSIWQNTCVTYTYEPGSTAKPFTVAMGLETGALEGDESFYCDGYEMVSGFKVKCVAKNGHGMQTIAQALSNSCNDSLMQISRKIGGTNFANYQSVFGFGQKTYIDLPGETSTAGLIYYEEDLNNIAVNLATNAFGQNFNTTMIQLGSGFCSLVNGGYLYQPHLVTRITDSNGNTLEEIKPVLQKRTISQETCNMLKDYMLETVATGTGKTAGVKGYAIGGKTGTAEKQPRDKENYLVSFIGFAPVEDPQVVVYVIVDEPNTPNQAHSTYAQTIAHDIFKQILPYMNIPSDLSEEEEAAAANALTQAVIKEQEQMVEGGYDVPGEPANSDRQE